SDLPASNCRGDNDSRTTNPGHTVHADPADVNAGGRGVRPPVESALTASSQECYPPRQRRMTAICVPSRGVMEGRSRSEADAVPQRAVRALTRPVRCAEEEVLMRH